jgi:hypothetical protein
VKLTLAAGLFVAASAAAFAQAPAGSSNTQNSSPQQPQGSTASQQRVAPQNEQTLTGCLTSADNIYTLTVMDDSGAPGTTAETTQYTLAPGTGVELQPLLNKRVTVKGTDAGPAAQTTNRVEMKSPPAPAATGTSGAASGANPKVQTTAKARINTKTFNVTNVQPASGSCGA